jgi:large subunit ribosomal protein L24
MKKYTKLNTRNRKYPSAKKVKVFKMKLKKGDKVRVISGKDKGKSGVILRSYPKTRTIIVEGMNVHKRHTRKVGNQSGRIIEKSLPIHISNVAKAA